MRSAPRGSDAGRAGWLILGLLAIPVLSVSGVALLVDVASTADPAAAAVGIPAVLGGALVGALVFRLGRVAYNGAVALRGALVRVRTSAATTSDGRHSWIPVPSVVRAPLVLIPASVGRRGPPLFSR